MNDVTGKESNKHLGQGLYPCRGFKPDAFPVRWIRIKHSDRDIRKQQRCAAVNSGWIQTTLKDIASMM
jgi:hypothetical protein